MLKRMDKGYGKILATNEIFWVTDRIVVVMKSSKMKEIKFTKI